MNNPTHFATLGALVLMSAAAQAQTTFPATLQGHALLPAATFIKLPVNAPANLSVSGRYLHADGRRRDALGSMPAIAFLSDSKAPRPTASTAASKASRCKASRA